MRQLIEDFKIRGGDKGLAMCIYAYRLYMLFQVPCIFCWILPGGKMKNVRYGFDLGELIQMLQEILVMLVTLWTFFPLNSMSGDLV